jgi:hypothetical protein
MLDLKCDLLVKSWKLWKYLYLNLLCDLVVPRKIVVQKIVANQIVAFLAAKKCRRAKLSLRQNVAPKMSPFVRTLI